MKFDYFKIFEQLRDGRISLVIDSIQKHESKGFKFNPAHTDGWGRTLLHWACFCCQTEIIKWLLKTYKIDVDLRDKIGYTSLELAIMNWYFLEYNHVLPGFLAGGVA